MSPGRKWTTETAKEAGRKGAEARWRKPRGNQPFGADFLMFMEIAGLTGPSRAPWRAFWKAVDALPMDDAELALYRRFTRREQPPAQAIRELVGIAGRRSEKTREMSTRAFYEAVRRDYKTILAPGERGVIPIIAADRKQAGQALGYVKGLASMAAFKPYVARQLKESIELTTGITIEVFVASYKTVRGYTVCALVADEIAFWLSAEDGANPDSEVLTALRPGMATVPGALLMIISTPYARRGELYRMYQQYFGKDDPRVLVWVADTASMNPTIDPAVIADAFAQDPLAAASEYGQDGTVSFRSDVEAFLTAEAVAAVTVLGRFELPPSGSAYKAFTDPSGGSQDAFTLAIAHRNGQTAVLDCVREIRPPFSPDAVVQEFADVLKSYGVRTVTGDAYGGEWPRERFAKHGVTYLVSAESKSGVYKQLLPTINAGRVELLDHQRLRTQLLGLERRVARGGRDSVDHAPGAHDDVANAVAGAITLAIGQSQVDGKAWAAITAGVPYERLPEHPGQPLLDPGGGASFQEVNPLTGGWTTPSSDVPVPAGQRFA